MNSLKFNVFGRRILVRRLESKWVVYLVGNEGKQRLATDIRLDPDTPETEILKSLDDLCHEWATPENPKVESLD